MNSLRKIVGVLLTAYMLTLILLPCADTCDSEEHLAYGSFSLPQEHHEQDNDQCSPLCTCACCASLITIVHSTQLNAFVPSVEKEFPVLKQSFLSAFADDCWQPPRFA